MGIIHHLTTIIRCSTSPDGLKRDAITLMTSLSKGSANNIIAMCDYGAYQTIIDVLLHSTDELLLASLRCMLSIISSVHQIGSKARFWSKVRSKLRILQNPKIGRSEDATDQTDYHCEIRVLRSTGSTCLCT